MDDFESIYRAYYKQIYFYLLDLCHDSSVAEEIAQETFFRVLKNYDKYRGECKISVWITQIAKNLYFNYAKKKKHEELQDTEEEDVHMNIEQSLINQEMAKEIHIILHRLPDPYREVFWMRTFGELSYQEIGAIHGKGESWARVTYYRAKTMIQEEMK